MAIKLLCFDFDGTLVHTAPDIISATNEFLILHGHKALSDQEVISHIGMGLVGLLHGVVPEAQHHPELRKEIERQFSKIYDAHVLSQPQPFDGVREFLSNCPKKIAVVSNKPQKYIHQLLRHLKLDLHPWTAVIGGDTYAECKPNPLPLLQAIKMADCSPQETLMVGDGPPDVGVAKACGTPFLGVSFGYSTPSELRALGAEHFIDHFAELPRAISRFESFDS